MNIFVKFLLFSSLFLSVPLLSQPQELKYATVIQASFNSTAHSLLQVKGFKFGRSGRGGGGIFSSLRKPSPSSFAKKNNQKSANSNTNKDQTKKSFFGSLLKGIGMSLLFAYLLKQFGGLFLGIVSVLFLSLLAFLVYGWMRRRKARAQSYSHVFEKPEILSSAPWIEK